LISLQSSCRCEHPLHANTVAVAAYAIWCWFGRYLHACCSEEPCSQVKTCWSCTQRLQVNGAGTSQLRTDRVGIRYAGVTQSVRSQPAASPAGTVDYTVLPSTSRRLAAAALVPAGASPANDSGATLYAGAQQLRKAMYSRKLLHAFADSPALPWFDLQGDGQADTIDSDAFFGIVVGVNWDPDTTDRGAKVCALLKAMYSPSTSADDIVDEALDDSSFVNKDSLTWQAVDPRLIYLRSSESSPFYASSPCPDLAADQVAPVLERFDGTQPPTLAQFAYLAAAKDADTDYMFNGLMRPSDEHFSAYQVGAAISLRKCHGPAY
jgi:hypothetical protein